MAIDKQYTVYHLHSDLSNGVTNIDSVTKYGEYIEKAKELGMKAMAFSEHGSVFEWWHKKSAIEAAGMKYIHAIEAYLTVTLDEKVRDNYHCVLLAKNYDGFLELNRLVSRSFDRTDNHFYYVPRITFDELFDTSDNILITTACVGGVFGKADADVESMFLEFIQRNKHRCFFEVGHHMDERQVEYNQKLYRLSEQTGIPLIAGTDTHMDTVRAEQRLLQDLETLLGQLTCADVSEPWLSDRRAFLDAAQYAVTERLRFLQDACERLAALNQDTLMLINDAYRMLRERDGD